MTPVLYQTKEDCCGCKACANACPCDAISFQADEYGFWYPVIDEGKCIGCNKCIKTCDFQKKEVLGNKPLAGLAARHKEKAVYDNSTSGGMFTAIAEWVLAKGGLVYGCVYNDDMKTVHTIAENKEQLAAMRNSKYVQSDVGFIYRDVKENLKKGKLVFFTGTPCQVAALYSFFGKTDQNNLLTADIVCHGVSSPWMWNKYVNYIEEKHHRRITDYRFRDKRFGWERPVISVIFEDGGSKWWFSTIDMYAENYYHHNLFRHSCLHCKYACSIRMGDFTICDFWGYQNSNLKMSTIEGVSACLLNTEKAKKIVGYLNINSEKMAPEIIIAGNDQLRGPVSKGKNWDVVMNTIKDEGFKKLLPIFRKTHRKAYLKVPIKKLLLIPRY